MGKPNEIETIEDSVIDETFRNVGNPSAIHKLGREDIVENRPGDVLVAAVKDFAANGGFERASSKIDDVAVTVTSASPGRVNLDVAKEIAEGVDLDAKSTEISE